MGSCVTLRLREIADGDDGVYYIAEMPIRNEEIIDYAVEVVPLGESSPIAFRFEQQFFTD